MSFRRQILFSCLLILFVFCVLVVSGELLLRFKGYREAVTEVFPQEPIMMERDPVLFWKHRADIYHYPGYSNGADRLQVTIWPGGFRATQERRPVATLNQIDRPNILLSGCSFMHGRAINDWETMGWKLQKRHPEWTVINAGTGAYGTYQVLLQIQKLFEESPSYVPDLVVYGLFEGHWRRNVAAFSWIRALVQSERNYGYPIPYVVPRDNPKGYEAHIHRLNIFPLRKQLALSAFLENQWDLYSKAKEREDQEFKSGTVIAQITRELNQIVTARGSKLLVMSLMVGEEPEKLPWYAHLTTEMEQNKIEHIFCQPKDYLHPSYRVIGEGHPTEKMNQYWTDCLENYLGRNRLRRHR